MAPDVFVPERVTTLDPLALLLTTDSSSLSRILLPRPADRPVMRPPPRGRAGLRSLERWCYLLSQSTGVRERR
jgi:hypothetical protein